MLLPNRYVPALVEDENHFPVHSRGYRLLELVDGHFKNDDGTPLVLEEWQRWVICMALEVYPPDHPRAGQLRWDYYLISIPRRAGKSVLSAVLSIGFLTNASTQHRVLGVAPTRPQANLIYGFAKRFIEQSPVLLKSLKTTRSRGITWRDDSGDYKIVTATPESLQGFGGHVVLDEAHILKPEIFEALSYSVRSHPENMMVITTTAGDDRSTTLQRLYAELDDSIALDNPEDALIGGLIYEAPENLLVPSLEALKAANPAVEAGRVDAAEILRQDEMGEGSKRHIYERYTYNRFVRNSEQWIDIAHWNRSVQASFDYDLKGAWIGVDRTPKGNWSSIAAAKVDPETGRIHTWLLGQFEDADKTYLTKLCKALRKQGVSGFVMDPYVLRETADDLKRTGTRLILVDQPTNYRAAATVTSLIERSRVRHANDKAVKTQIPNGMMKVRDDGSWRIVRVTPQSDIDSLMATLYAIYACHEKPAREAPEIVVWYPNSA